MARLGRADPKRKLPVLNFGGQSAELWCEGGEARFVTQLIAESAHFQHKVLWFSTLVSKASNLPAIQTALKKAGVLESQVVEMSQGQKQAVSSPGPSRPNPSSRSGANVGLAKVE